MAYKRVCEKSLRKCEKAFFEKNSPTYSEDEKEIIIQHLASGTEYGITSQEAEDFVTGELLGGYTDNLFTDGEYAWTFATKYHVEKYNIPLNRDFVDFVLSEDNHGRNPD